MLSCFSRVRLFATLRDCDSPGFSVHGNSSDKNTGVGCHALLQGIFQAQGSNPALTIPTLAGGFFTTSATWEALKCNTLTLITGCEGEKSDHSNRIKGQETLRRFQTTAVIQYRLLTETNIKPNKIVCTKKRKKKRTAVKNINGDNVQNT